MIQQFNSQRVDIQRQNQITFEKGLYFRIP